MPRKEIIGQLIRFGIVGTTAAAIHYAIYWILQHWINVNVAYTTGYILSFLVNYYLSARFTFREKTSVKNGIGFGGAHLTNYLLQSVVGCYIFYGYGLSCYRRVGITYAVLIGFGMVVCQYLFCRWWFRSHTRGPLESLWKKLTWIKTTNR